MKKWTEHGLTLNCTKFPIDASFAPYGCPTHNTIPTKARVKFGIDPTFPRLHLGHLVPLRVVKKFQDNGHDVTIVIGTFTAQMGDPSGRDTTRPILTEEEVLNNASHITVMVRRILGHDIPIFNNGEASFNQMKVPDMMLLASKFTVQQMLARASFQTRMQNNNPLGLHELLVPILQGWDSVALKTEIEIGGQDQLFNFQIARFLQEQWGQKPQLSVLTPIINGTDGRKMSKSYNNCIWLDDDPVDVFGKVMSISDDVMREWIPLLSSEPNEAAVLGPMEEKMQLAWDITKQLYGQAEANAAWEHFTKTIVQKEVPKDIPFVQVDTLMQAIIAIRKCSKTEAKRLLAQGGVSVDGQKVDQDGSVCPGQVVKVGPRNFGRVILRTPPVSDIL
jgi:tyrosyl-tRNA synthetase